MTLKLLIVIVTVIRFPFLYLMLVKNKIGFGEFLSEYTSFRKPVTSYGPAGRRAI